MPTDNASGGPDEGAGHFQVLRSIMSQIATVREEQAELDRRLSAQAATVEELVRGVGADVKSLLRVEKHQAEQGVGADAESQLQAGGHSRSVSGQQSRAEESQAESSLPGDGTPRRCGRPDTPGSGRPVLRSSRCSFRGSRIRTLAGIPTSPDLVRATKSTKSAATDVPPGFPALRPTCTLKPDSPPRLAIDCCTIAALVFDAFSVPFVIAWDPPIEGFLRVTMFGTTFVWFLDLCANFVTGFYEDGLLVTDPATVARHYLRHWFPLDFGIVLMDVLNIVFEMTEGMGDETVSIHLVTMFRVFKIQRFIRFLAILRLGRIWSRVHDVKGMLEFSVSRSKLWLMLIEILKFLIVILWLNHCLCCIFYAIGRLESTDTGESWLDRFDHRSVTTEFEYTTAFHFTLTQMTPGSMEVFATNSLERVFTIMWLLFGLLFGSSLVSYLSAHLVQFNQQNTERSKQQATVRRFLRQHGINAVLAYRVQHDIMHRVAGPAPLLEREIPCLLKLSVHLRAELWLAMFTPHISPHPLFYTWHFIDPFTTRDICFACHFVYLPSGDELFPKGCRKTSAHILAKGVMKYTEHDSMYLTEDSPEVTDGAWISEAAWWMNWTTQGCMETLADCKLVCLEASQLMEVLANHPHTEALILAYGHAFHKLASSLPSEELSDLSFLDHGEVVSHMPREERKAIADIVLRQQRAWTTRSMVPMSPADVESLRSEVDRGQSALVFGRAGRPVRVVSIVVLHIVWPSRARILAQLAKVREAEPAPRCQLPATKCSEDESPHDAAARLFSQFRVLLPDGYEGEFGEYEKVVVHQHRSDSYPNLPSRFTRNIFRMQIKDQEAGHPPSPQIYSSAAQSHEAVKLFSWLSLEDYERFSSGVDVADLAARITGGMPETVRIAC